MGLMGWVQELGHVLDTLHTLACPPRMFLPGADCLGPGHPVRAFRGSDSSLQGAGFCGECQAAYCPATECQHVWSDHPAFLLTECSIVPPVHTHTGMLAGCSCTVPTTPGIDRSQRPVHAHRRCDPL